MHLVKDRKSAISSALGKAVLYSRWIPENGALAKKARKTSSTSSSLLLAKKRALPARTEERRVGVYVCMLQRR